MSKTFGFQVAMTNSFLTIKECKELMLFNIESIITEKYESKNFRIKSFIKAFANSINQMNGKIRLDKLNKEFEPINITFDENKYGEKLLEEDYYAPNMGILSACTETENNNSIFFIFINDIFLKKEYNLGYIAEVSAVLYDLYAHEYTHKHQHLNRKKLLNSEELKKYDNFFGEVDACAREAASYLLRVCNNDFNKIKNVINGKDKDIERYTIPAWYLYMNGNSKNRKHRFLKRLYDFLEIDKE